MSEARRLRNLQWIREAGVEEDRRSRASRVLEVDVEASPEFVAYGMAVRGPL